MTAARRPCGAAARLRCGREPGPQVAFSAGSARTGARTQRGNVSLSTLWNLVPGWDQAFTFLAYLVIFTPLELLFPAQRGRRLLRPGWGTDLAYFILNAIPIGIGLSAIIAGSIVLGKLVLPEAFQAWVAAQPLWLQVLAGTVIADLFFYFGHRLQHEVPWLWDFHSVHHSSEQLDWLAAFRIHPIDQMIEKGSSLVPVFALGFSPAAIFLIAVIYQWQSILIHANVRLPVGWLKWLVATPLFHHWHHARDPAARNRNYAAQLPLWDLVFGTAHLPDHMPERYGIDEAMPGTYLRQIVYPFGQTVARLRRRWHGRTAGASTRREA